MGHIVHGAYHIDFEKEIGRMMEELKKIGIRDANKIETSALIAYKNRMAKMDKIEVFRFFKQIRGIGL
jgi:uncharacterized protein (DUF302 family)